LIVSFAIHHSVARRWICGVVSHTEAVIFVANATFSIYILPSPNRPPLAWAIRRAASLRRYHTKTHSTSPMNLHSLIPYLLQYIVWCKLVTYDFTIIHFV